MAVNWSRVLRRVLVLLLWIEIVAFVVFAAMKTGDRRKELVVKRINIELKDSSDSERLVSEQRVRQWIKSSGIKCEGAVLDYANVQGIEDIILRNGFVDKAVAYVNHDGVMTIEIRQRTPLLRLICEGYDCYITREGYVFRTPPQSAYYIPVVTGSYRPPFSPSYNGPLGKLKEDVIAHYDNKIAQIEREKYPLYNAEKANAEKKRELRRRYTKKRLFEEESSFEARVEQLREEKRILRKRYRYEELQIVAQIERITQKQEIEKIAQKKSIKKYEDFANLLNFVEYIADDEFWNAEVVQLVVSTSQSGRPFVEIIPRSERFGIIVGELTGYEEKLDKLGKFYRKALPYIERDTIAELDIRYAGRVVCR